MQVKILIAKHFAFRLRDVNKDEHEPKEVAFHFSSPFPRKGNIPAFPMDLSSIKKSKY